MLKKCYNKLPSRDVGINIEKNTLGIPIKINPHAKNVINECNLSQICNIERLNLASLGKNFHKLLSQLNLHHESVNYKFLLPDTHYKSYLLDLKSKLSFILNNITDYYFNTLAIRKKLTNNLVNITYDEKLIKPPIYLHDSSLTGRMTIKNGLNYLTLSKSQKKLFKPNKNKILQEVDFISCEPNFLNAILGHKNIDLYEYFMEKFKLCDRNKIKIGMLSTMYGGNYNSIKKISGLNQKQIDYIKDYFHIDEIKKSLEVELQQKGKIYNYYGRPIFSNTRSLINHWLQSSSADYCSEAFYNLSLQEDVGIVAIIHDGVIIETEKNTILPNILKDINGGISLKIKVNPM